MSRRSLLISVALLFVALVSQLVIRVSVISSRYELQALRVKSLELDTQHRELSLEHAVSTRPETLINLARERLSFSELTPQQIRSIPQNLFVSNDKENNDEQV